MRAYHFFMKFMRSFAIGLACGFAAVAIVISLLLLVYVMYYI